MTHTKNVAAVAESKPGLTLTDRLRVRFKGTLNLLGTFFLRLGFKPNMITALGFIGTTVGAYFLSIGSIQLGGWIVLVMGLFDALDGTMARLKGEPTIWGAFIDSVTDRYSELVIFGGIMIHFLHQNRWPEVALVYLAAAGSVLVSYIRARGQALGYDTKVGILTRFERYLVLAPSLVLNIPLVGVAIIAIFANITALQRIYDIRRQLHEKY